MPIWISITSYTLMGIIFLAFCRVLYFQVSVIFAFPIRTLADFERLRVGPWSERELGLRNKWLQAIIQFGAIIGLLLIGLFLIALLDPGMQGDCEFTGKNTGSFLFGILKGTSCAPNA